MKSVKSMLTGGVAKLIELAGALIEASESDATNAAPHNTLMFDVRLPCKV